MWTAIPRSTMSGKTALCKHTRRCLPVESAYKHLSVKPTQPNTRLVWFTSNHDSHKAQYTRRRRDSTVELSRVGDVNAPVGSRVPVYNFLCRWAIEVGDKWRHNDVIVEKVINIDQNSRRQTAMFSFLIVDRIRRQSSWASCELCSHRRCRRDATRQLSCVGVGGVYRA